MEIRAPETDAEWDAYFKLRYVVLREHWGQRDGSERDELEDTAIHAAAYEAGKLLAVGRVHFNTPTQAQVRYMAVLPEHVGQGLGAKILTFLETQARQNGAAEIVLNAREEAVGFYTRAGYESLGPGPLLWDVIPHEKMRKTLPKTEAADA